MADESIKQINNLTQINLKKTTVNKDKKSNTIDFQKMKN